jgi:hypothetical protein
MKAHGSEDRSEDRSESGLEDLNKFIANSSWRSLIARLQREEVFSCKNSKLLKIKPEGAWPGLS